jgi:hypothetical protein
MLESSKQENGEPNSFEEFQTLSEEERRKKYEKMKGENNKDSSQGENVLDSSPKNPEQTESTETVVGKKATEDTTVEKRDLNPIAQWNELINEKKGISKKVSSGEMSEEEGAKDKINVSWQIIEQGCKMLGINPEEKRKEIEEEQARQWKLSLEASFGKNGDAEAKYQARERENAEREAIDKEMEKSMKLKWDKLPDSVKENYDNNISVFSQHFYEGSRREVFERTSDNAGKNGIFLSKPAFCKMINEGFDPENIRDAGATETIKHFFGGGFLSIAKSAFSGKELVALPFTDVDGRKGSRVMGFDNLQRYIFQAEKDFKAQAIKNAGDLDEQAQERFQKNKSSAVDQFVLNRKIKEIQESLLLQQKQQRRQEKIEKAGKISAGDRLEIINDLRNKKSEAEKISKALKTGRKIKTKKGEIMDPKNQKEELEKMKGALSDDIIRMAEQLTGRNLRKEAKLKTGYVPDKENPDKQKQKEFREWLTKEVKIIEEEQKKIIKVETGRPLIYKRKK